MTSIISIQREQKRRRQKDARVSAEMTVEKETEKEVTGVSALRSFGVGW